MRRVVPLFAACASLVCALPAAARLEPVRHDGPRVHRGVLPAQTGPGARVRVIVRLGAPPLTARRLAVNSTRGRAYVQAIAQQQARAAAQIRAAIPQARIGRRFQVVLDALTVSLPAAKLPALVREQFVTKVYPSLPYVLDLDRSPSVIGADVLHSTTGADGSGIKIGVIDDGIDQTNRFFNPAGFSYPTGFPLGDTKYTTPKVIVARVFPGPNAGAAGHLPLDPASSFHGTHVAGIAAGVAGTTAPAGRDHPQVTGLSGVAPRAWLGNYRVFTVPTPIGHVANTPEVIAAFEAAVKDGMNVINFSGGGPEVDPASDALIETVHNVTAAGVMTVIAAGNDRDEFGLGSVGSPGTAPDAIAVAAVSNAHAFAPKLDAVSPGAPADAHDIPFYTANGDTPVDAWSTSDQTLVDAGAVTEPHLCSTPPARAFTGAIVLVTRGLCPLAAKADRAKRAGAAGIIFVDNREGEAETLGLALPIPGGMIANLDGAHLRAWIAASGGRTLIRVSHESLEIDNRPSGVVTSFSSAGPTAFGHRLKPDVSAPGGQILSATLANTDDSRFAVFDGTSMATPHVSGAVALILQLHPGWTPSELKSALVSTAVPAWGDTARTGEAPVPLEGGGLVSLPRATDPRLFTEPTSLSFGDLQPDSSEALDIRLADAGGGAGTWQVQVVPQAGAAVDAAGVVAIAPGGGGVLEVRATAGSGAPSGENYGFVVLKQGAVTRRIPYLFLVSRPALAAAAVQPLRKRQSGDTRTGVSLVAEYRYPAAPFGNNPDQPPMNEDGAERVFAVTLARKAVNAGVSIVSESSGARIDPWWLGAKDENAVQGFAGTPVDVNNYTYDYLEPIGAAGATFPQPGTYYVSVDSGRDRITGRRLAGSYVLRSWVNDVTPPSLRLLTTRVSTGRPTLVFRTTDAGSGVDPRSLTIGYRGALVAVGSYDPDTGLATFPLPGSFPTLAAGKTAVRMVASDFQEAKNVDTIGPKIMPNTRSSRASLRVVAGPAVDWLVPERCALRRQQLMVAAGSPAGVVSVRFAVDGRRVATARRGDQGLWRATVGYPRGRHTLTATVLDRKGRTASARRMVRQCDG